MSTWLDVTVGDYGWIGRLTLQQDGMAQNISTYTTRSFILRAPSGEVKTLDAIFTTDGADGVLQRTFVDGDIDEVGTWSVQARINKTGVELTSATLSFDVAARID